ncbi:MAG: UbiA family prenyltransferase [Calditrichia bacterium]
MKINAISYFLRKYLGWRNWAVFTYNAFIENIFIVFYIALSQKNFSNGFLINILYFYGFSIFSTSYGYLANDLADRDLDAIHKKPNTFAQNSYISGLFIVLFTFLMSAIFALPFINNKWFVLAWLIWFFLTSTYSFKPIRLKERGKIGLISVVFAQRIMPTLLVFAAFGFLNLWMIILITTYIFFRGLSSDINHQLEDYHLDIKTDTKTFAVIMGFERTKSILRSVLEIEKLLLLLVLFSMFLDFNIHFSMQRYLFFLVMIFYIFIYIFSLYRIRTGDWKNPFDTLEKSIFQFIHHPFPSVLLPVFLLCNLSFFNPYYLLILILFLWNKGLLYRGTIANSYPYALIKKMSPF